MSFRPDLLEILLTYHWPGGMLEVGTIAQRLGSISLNELGFEHLPSGVRETILLGTDAVGSSDREAFQRLYDDHGGNRTRIAAALGTSRQQVHRLMKRHGVSTATPHPRTEANRRSSGSAEGRGT